MQFFRTLGLVATSAGLVLAMPAAAHLRVAASTPAAASTASKVKTVSVTFSDAFLPAMSGLEIVMTGMPGMAGHHPAMKMAGVKVAPSADRKTLIATAARPLPAGTYDVNWHVVGADNHRVTGKITFTAR